MRVARIEQKFRDGLIARTGDQTFAGTDSHRALHARLPHRVIEGEQAVCKIRHDVAAVAWRHEKRFHRLKCGRVKHGGLFVWMKMSVDEYRGLSKKRL